MSWSLVPSYNYPKNGDVIQFDPALVPGGCDNSLPHTLYMYGFPDGISAWDTVNANFSETLTCDGTTCTSSTTPPPISCDTTKTNICQLLPAESVNGATTANPVTFSLKVYIAPADIGNIIGVKIALHNIDQNLLLFGDLSPSDIYLFEGQATTSGMFEFSTTTVVGEGDYRIQANLTRTYLYGVFQDPYDGVNQEVSHHFIVGAPSVLGQLNENGYEILNGILQGITASSSASTTSAYLARGCNPLSWDTTNCMVFLFVPDSNALNKTLTGFHDGVMVRIPWGYFTRFVAIMNTQGSSTLPAFVAHVQVGAGSDMTPEIESIHIDPGDMLQGANTLLENTRDPFYGKNLRDVMTPFVQLTVALAVLLYIITDLTGYESDGESGAPLSTYAMIPKKSRGRFSKSGKTIRDFYDT